MKLDITRVDVWAAGIKDKTGSLNQKLESLAQAGVSLEFVVSRRTPEKRQGGVVYVTPIKGPKQIKAATKAGFKKTKALHSIRVAATDKPGLGTQITRQITDANINLRGFSGAAIGKRALFHLAFDSTTDAGKALRKLKQLSS